MTISTRNERMRILRNLGLRYKTTHCLAGATNEDIYYKVVQRVFKTVVTDDDDDDGVAFYSSAVATNALSLKYQIGKSTVTPRRLYNKGYGIMTFGNFSKALDFMVHEPIHNGAILMVLASHKMPLPERAVYVTESRYTETIDLFIEAIGTCIAGSTGMWPGGTNMFKSVKVIAPIRVSDISVGFIGRI